MTTAVDDGVAQPEISPTDEQPANGGSIFRQSAALGLFALAATALLMFGEELTREPIGERQAEDLRASLGEVIPQALYDGNLLDTPLLISGQDGDVTVYRARKEGSVSAVAFTTIANGYGGEITLMMGVDVGGEITGVRVLSHAETPGLGDKIEVAKSDWILAFDGLSGDEPLAALWKVKKDGGHFDQFSGATITPRAVVQGVRRGLDFFHLHRELLTQPPEAGLAARQGAIAEGAAVENQPGPVAAGSWPPEESDHEP